MAVRKITTAVAAALTGLVLWTVPAHAAVPVLVVDGQGYGHGVGLAQDGAYWMGRSGSTTAQILGHFYPGVSAGRADGVVRVEVLRKDERELVVTFPTGGEVRSPVDGQQQPGFPVAVPPGGEARIRFDGAYRVDVAGPVQAESATRAQIVTLPGSPSTTSTTSPSRRSTTTTSKPLVSAPPSRTSSTSVWAVPADDGTIGVPDRAARYRGVIEANASGGPLRLVNQLPVEQYLRGMGEVRDPSWPLASLRAQAIVARTYALRVMQRSGEICDTEKCQVYLGQQAEYPQMDKAVADTAGQVLVYGGALAAAVYSANGAGVSASPNEGFGTPDSDYPYLRAVTYETYSPDPWQARIALGDLASRLRYPGSLTSVSVAATGASGRPTVVALDGSAGPMNVAATDMDRALGLRSTKWSTRIELGDAPAPPPEAEVIQSLPDDLVTPVAPAASAPAGPHGAPAVVRPAPKRHRSRLAEEVLALLLVIELGVIATTWRPRAS